MAEYTEGLMSGVLSANEVLADTGPMSGSPTVTVLVSASVAATVEIQRRNAANDANQWSQRMFLSVAAPVTVPLSEDGSNFDTDERLRVVLISSMIGAVQSSILV